MSTHATIKRGMWFEDFEVGLQVITGGRTVTEADIVAFAGLSGDHNQIHTDEEFTKSTNFGKRVAHGLLGLSIASGLIAQTGVLEGTVIAFREINDWKFTQAIFIGDTIHVEMTITDVKALPRIGGGSVKLQLDVVNQTGDVVMRGTWTALMVSKPAAE